MQAGILNKILRIKAALFLVLLVLFSYLLLSKNLYIPNEAIMQFSFGFVQPQNIVFYELIHIGPYHLLSNIAALLVFGIAVELSLSSKDVLAIFFSSTILTAIIFALTNPFAVVIGASAGILSMVTAAFFASPKKAIIAGIIAILFGAMLFLWTTNAISLAFEQFNAQEKQVQSGIEQAIIEKDTVKQQQLTQELETITREKTVFEQGNLQEKNSVSDFFSHLFAATFGVAYVFFFRKKAFIASVEQIDNFLCKTAKRLR